MGDGKAEVIAARPGEPAMVEDVKRTLNVDAVDFRVALPADLIRIIENNYDVNPGSPPSLAEPPLLRSEPIWRKGARTLPCNGQQWLKAGRAWRFLELELLW